MFATRNLENIHRPAGAGANYQYLTKSTEDDLFHDKADKTQWKHDFTKFTAHQAAVIVQGLTNAGLGKTATGTLTKTPDKLFDGYTVSAWHGIKPNTDAGVTKCSWVNCRALYVNKGRKLKVSTQPIFEVDGATQMVYMELMGLLSDYASMIGLCYTKEQLIEESRFDTILFDPWFGFPMQSRSVSECIINYDSIASKGKGMLALPYEISTGSVVGSTSVDFTLATNCVWLSVEERTSLLSGYHEMIFKELVKIGEHSEDACRVEKKISIDLNCKGPVCYLWLTIQSKQDVDSGVWTKLCDDYGLDYISQFMLVTGTTSREDGLPAAFYRTAKVLECFKNRIDRHVYLLSFQTSEKEKFTGHQTMTNIDKLQLAVTVNPHPDTHLLFNVTAAVVNGVYNERGGTGKVWA